MDRYTDNLDNYKSFPDTTSCYLDGRYFNKVFSRYPGLLRNPFHIHITRNKRTGEVTYRSHLSETNINNRFPGLLRVVINSPEGRHSSLVIIDYHQKKLFRFDPHGSSSMYFDQVNRMIEEYFDQFMDIDNMYNIEAPVLDEKNPNCVRMGVPSGFCVAYNIKYAYDYLNGRQYDPYQIRKFVSAIEGLYGPLPEEGKDVEYGLFGNDNPNQGRNALIGGLGGLFIGGALAGPAGALAGGIGGGLIGSTI